MDLFVYGAFSGDVFFPVTKPRLWRRVVCLFCFVGYACVWLHADVYSMVLDITLVLFRVFLALLSLA